MILDHDGVVRIERGFIRPADERPQPEAEEIEETSATSDPEGAEDQAAQDERAESTGAADEEEDDRPLSDVLVRDLTAHRTLGLRLNLSEQPEVAIVAVTHALAAQIFYLGADAHVVGIQPIKTDLTGHSDGIEDTPEDGQAARAIRCAHCWARR